MCIYCRGCRDCNEGTQCTEGDNTYAIIGNSYSPSQVENWGSGNIIFANSADDIYEHYDFYLHLHNLDTAFNHPDSIIVYNGW